MCLTLAIDEVSLMILLRRRFSPCLLVALCGLPAAWAQQTTSFTTASAGNWTAFVAPNSIAAGFGSNFSTSTTSATSLPLGTSLGNASISITDSAGVKTSAQLYMVSPGQINYLIPATAALGKATVTVTANSSTYTGPLEVSNVSPAIFSANNSGAGVAAAQFLTVSASGQTSVQNTAAPGIINYVPAPFMLPSSGQAYLILYGTGIRNHSQNPVQATINGVAVPVLYASAQGSDPGLDQVNLGPLPQTLAGTGKTFLNVVVTVDGIPANTTTIAIN
jgi:uncharacterized protein (TIGR03437 family)